jgi:hypothetical protein
MLMKESTVAAPCVASLSLIAADIVRRHRNHLQELEILLTNHGLILHGVALSYYGKQLAFHTVEQRLGMRVVANYIVVKQHNRAESSASSEAETKRVSGRN